MVDKSKSQMLIIYGSLVTFAIFLQLETMLHDYIYSNFDVQRNLLLIFLWIIPVISYALFFRKYNENRIFHIILMVVFVPAFISLENYIYSEYFGETDFEGVVGAWIIFKINIVINLFALVLGYVIGNVLHALRSA